jgi:hypothetical protein
MFDGNVLEHIMGLVGISFTCHQSIWGSNGIYSGEMMGISGSVLYVGNINIGMQ